MLCIACNLYLRRFEYTTCKTHIFRFATHLERENGGCMKTHVSTKFIFEVGEFEILFSAIFMFKN